LKTLKIYSRLVGVHFFQNKINRHSDNYQIGGKIVKDPYSNLSNEDMISEVMITVQTFTDDYPQPKKLAVDRYMRTVLRALTRHELKLAYSSYRFRELTPDLEFKLNQASRGYDHFMEKRKWNYR